MTAFVYICFITLIKKHNANTRIDNAVAVQRVVLTQIFLHAQEEIFFLCTQIFELRYFTYSPMYISKERSSYHFSFKCGVVRNSFFFDCFRMHPYLQLPTSQCGWILNSEICPKIHAKVRWRKFHKKSHSSAAAMNIKKILEAGGAPLVLCFFRKDGCLVFVVWVKTRNLKR